MCLLERKVFCKIFVLDFVMFAVASHTASLAAADVHCIEELLFAIHALKLNISIAGRGNIVFFVLVSFLENGLSLLVFFLDFLLDL